MMTYLWAFIFPAIAAMKILANCGEKDIYEKTLKLSGDGKEVRRALVLAGRQLISHSQMRCTSFSTADFQR